MSKVIPEKYVDLFQKPAFASLGTVMPDGRPQVTPVWCDFDGQHVMFNSARGRQKDRNVRRDPRVALAIIDPDNPYRYWRFAAPWLRLPKTAPTNTSISWRRSTWDKTNIPTPSRERFACFTKSGRSTPR